MDSTQTIYILLSNLAIMIPQLIVIIIGIVFCFSKMSGSPKASRLALSGLGIMFIISLLRLGLNVMQIQLPLWYRESYQTIAYINFGVGIVLNIIWSVGLGLIIYAIWAGRDKE